MAMFACIETWPFVVFEVGMICFVCDEKTRLNCTSFCNSRYARLRRYFPKSVNQSIFQVMIGDSELPIIKVIHDTELDMYELSFKYDPALINLLKGAIPSSNRLYNPDTKTWTLDSIAWKKFEPIGRSAGYLFVVSSKKIEHSYNPEDFFYYHSEHSSSSNSETTASIAAKLSGFLGVTITSQDISELKRLYRVKARELHPDFGGDPAKMSELNRLWTLYTNQEKVQ
jgi:hypothetical protein